MTCHDTRQLFTALADDVLSVAERARAQAHLDGCADCRRDWERFLRTLDALHRLPRPRAPLGFADRVLKRSRSRLWSRRLLRQLFVPLRVKLPLEAAAIAVISLGVVYVIRQSPELEHQARSVEPRPEAVPPAIQTDLARPRAFDSAPPAGRQAVAKAERPAPRVHAPTESPPRAESQPAPSAPAREDKEVRAAMSKDSASRSLRAPATASAAVTITAQDREGSERALAGALARAGGVEIARRTEGGTLVVEAELPRAAWAGFVEALRRAVGLTIDGEPSGSGERLRVVLRLGA